MASGKKVSKTRTPVFLSPWKVEGIYFPKIWFKVKTFIPPHTYCIYQLFLWTQQEGKLTWMCITSMLYFEATYMYIFCVCNIYVLQVIVFPLIYWLCCCYRNLVSAGFWCVCVFGDELARGLCNSQTKAVTAGESRAKHCFYLCTFELQLLSHKHLQNIHVSIVKCKMYCRTVWHKIVIYMT